MNVNFGCEKGIVSTQPRKMPPFVLEENPETGAPPFALQENPRAKTSIYGKMTPEKFQAFLDALKGLAKPLPITEKCCYAKMNASEA